MGESSDREEWEPTSAARSLTSCLFSQLKGCKESRALDI